jgi:uncharacterized protein (DUF111 family)
MEQAGISGWRSAFMDFGHREEHVDEEMLVLQANIDDMNPELCSYVGELLFEAGANDVYWIPIIMKKGRPGIMLNVLLNEDKLSGVEEVVFRETTTIGIRYMAASCHRLGRTFTEVVTPWGVVSVKAGYHKGKLVQFSPEFKDCERLARDYGVPLKRVYEEARARFLDVNPLQN